MLRLVGLFAAAAVMLLPIPAAARVRIIMGPTPIPDGQAKSAGDITLVNEKLAAAIAVTTAPPWAIPRGALIDAAPVTNGLIGRDHIAFADFLPNSWSAWPSTYQHVTIITDTPKLAVVRAVRDWNAVVIETTYSLKSGDDSLHIVVTMTNRGATPVENILSGLTLWSQGGYFFGVPGLPHTTEGPAGAALSDRIVAYDRDWAIALHAPGFNRFGYGQRDLYLRHTLPPGGQRTFEGWLQIVGRGDLAPVVAAEIKRKQLPFGRLTGQVEASGGGAVETAVVMVERDGLPYAWALADAGRYAIDLPAGVYTVYATGEGYSETPPQRLTLAAGSTTVRDFAGIEPPGRVRFALTDKATGAPIDARIDILQGQKPVVEYLGKHTFFTELTPRGQTEISLAPGTYRFSVGSRAGFDTSPVTVTSLVSPGARQTLSVAIQRQFDPAKMGWYGADMHHHSDQEDGVTPPAAVARSELAAGLDVLFLSDHDTTVNHRAMQAIADARGLIFIPSMELSPSWGHFNAYPLRLGEPPRLEMNTASVQEVFKEARRLGATAIQVNHPYDPGEGYFASLDRGVANGGFDPDFQLLEINGAQADKDGKVIASAWRFWNEGRRYYLTAGSDTHDVWNGVSGDARVYVHVDGALTVESFVDGLKRGHAFVSHGPLVFPDHMYGETVTLKAGQSAALGFDLEAVNGLKQATLISGGKQIDVVHYAAGQTAAHLTAPITAPATGSSPGWFALTVEDAKGMTAYTDPIWIATAP
jgi:hypothetical protein